MHIIVLENQPTASRGGQHLSLLDVCRGLQARGHTISLLYEKAGDLLEQYQQFCPNILPVSGCYAIQHKTDIFRLMAEVWQLKWQIPDHKNSIVYINQYHDSLFGAALALAKNIPLVCHLRQAAPPELPGQWSLGLKGVKQFVAVSTQTKHDWMKTELPPEKIAVVYNAINTEIFQPPVDFAQLRQAWQIPVADRVILYVGRIDRVKGLETLIKALALLQQNSQVATKLLIAGKPVSHQSLEAGLEYKKSLELLITQLGLEKSVSFLGHVTNTVPLYQVSDVTVLPSINSEPFGRTIIESMACGTPAIASQIGGIPEILTGELQQQLFAPGDEIALASRLSQVLNWRSQAPQLGQQCREHAVANFSLNKMVDGIEQVLLNVVK